MDKRLLEEMFRDHGQGKGRKEGDEYVITFPGGKEIRIPSKARKISIIETTEIIIEQPRKEDLNGRGLRSIRPRKKRKAFDVVGFVKSLFEDDK